MGSPNNREMLIWDWQIQNMNLTNYDLFYSMFHLCKERMEPITEKQDVKIQIYQIRIAFQSYE